MLTTLGNLYRIYSNLDSVEDSEVRDKILASLEKRWAAADQEPYIAVVVLNPYLRGDFFGRNIALTPIGLTCSSACNKWTQIFMAHLYYNKRWLWWTGPPEIKLFPAYGRHESDSIK